MATMTAPENVDTPQGLAFAITAYLLWGFLPIYMKWVSYMPAAEVVAHRIIWSLPIAAGLLIVLRRTRDLRAALTDPRTLLMGCVTAALISVNWGIYVWAVATGHTLDAALGYYINPLFSIFLGAVLLGERLDRMQIVAIALAALAVIFLTWQAGRIPLAALGLTFSWGFYALCKKRLPIGPNQGFLLEVLILLPFALGYVLWLQFNGTGHFGGADHTLLLLGCGIVTAVPLIIYANGAKLLRLSTIGILQYIAPTLIFLVAVFLFREPFGTARAGAFALIWVALALYSSSLIRQMRRGRQGTFPPPAR